MSRRLALALLAAACNSPGGDGGTEATSAASEVSGTPTSGAPQACGAVTQCPPPALCETVDCLDELCTYPPQPVGEFDDDQPGDCQRWRCDGEGSATPTPDVTDLPDDGNACTVDQCGASGPEHLPQAPGSACDGGFCHDDLICRPCPARDSCVDDSAAEPNETQSQAHKLPQRSDDDGLAYLCEALGGPEDVDWFTLETVDVVLGKVAPGIVGEPASLRLCMYFQCSFGGTDVVCPEGSVADNAPLGQRGCCGVGGFAPQIDCQGFVEDATVWLRVAHDPEAAGEPPACLLYQVGYEY